MSTYPLQIVKDDLLRQFKDKVDANVLTTKFAALEDAALSNENFSFYTSVASVYSSKIEGEPIELDSYIKHKDSGLNSSRTIQRKLTILLEKWFLAQHLGPQAWFVQSEKYYYLHHHEYYNNIRLLRQEYDELNYSAALPFVMMLSRAVLNPGK
ncbi:hypothetical protein [Chitinophaga sp. Ak27]|uniref:hypothetical protein n=1 Tax=Chitinophaga sp. Ak27 TaxID=2726116 RepID=UPI001B7D2853|nr:hypothetical protein [Chitinophaga sp. Ak27]